MSILTYVDKVCVFIFPHQIRVRSMFLEFLEIVEGGVTPAKRIPGGISCRFPINFAFYISPFLDLCR